MKPFVFAFAAAILIASLLLTPAYAAPAKAGMALGTCGSTYTVKNLDNLSKIASHCGVTLADILAGNPQIANPNLIYSGQVLNMTGNPENGSTYSAVDARVTVSTTSTYEGGSVTVYVRGFPANSWIDYRIGRDGEEYSVVYDGTVAKDGTTSLTFTVPTAAYGGEYWVVLVTTTSQKDGVDVYSPKIYINY